MALLDDFQQLMQAGLDSDVPETGETDRIVSRVSAAAPAGNSLAGLVRATDAQLSREIIGRIHAQVPEFFERLVIDVLLAMGYGKNHADMAQRLGRSGDGGIDGLIPLDELGLDLLFIQAKRLKPGVPVPISDVRDFAGSLEARHAAKGVLVATTHFSAGAVEFCSRLSRRIVLIDGQRLAELMIRHNIGVTVKEIYLLKMIDGSYFGSRTIRGDAMPKPAR
jgi:restriction system protein